MVDRSHRRAFRPLAHLGGGRVLALGQPVDAVVEEYNHHIDVAAQYVQEMVAADAQAIAVAGDNPDLEIWSGGLKPGGDRRGTPVDAMEAVGVNEDDLLARDTEVRHQLLGLGEDRIVAAAWTPADLLVRDEVFAGQRHRFSNCLGCHPIVTLLRTS